MAQQHINYSTPNDGLGDTLRTSQVKAESNFNELYSNKVDKVVGKGLSDTNFTQVEKDKLAGLEEGGQVQSDWNEGDSGSKAFILGKPTNVSEFFNDGDGVSAFVADVDEPGTFARSSGLWVDIADFFQPNILDGFAGVTAGFSVGQLTYNLPAGSKCIDVYVAHGKQYKTTAANTALTTRWSQSGDNVIITKSPALNNYIYIEYI